MFCDGGGMQLSAANLLIASQQLARPRAAADAPAQFAAALSKASNTKAAGFEAMDFKQTAPAKPAQAAAPAAAPATGYNMSGRLGANLDIRV
jgi:hypothetical protein